MKNHKPTLSLVILCFREGDYIPIYVRAVQESLVRHDIPHQLILVANYFCGDAAEQDSSSRIVRELAVNDTSIVPITREKRRGEKMGWDLRTGLAVATGDIVGFTDGDGQVEAEDMARAYNLIVERGFDAVFGRRVAREDGAWRAFTSRAYNILFRVFFPQVSIHDVNGKPKLFTKKKLLEIKLSSNNWFADSEMVIQSVYRRFSIGILDTVFRANTRRPSTTSPWSVVESIYNLIQYRLKMWFNRASIL